LKNLNNMAEIIILEGPSGSGKSASLEDLPVKESIIITPNTKPLPFRGGDTKWGKRKMLKKSFTELSEALDQVEKAAKVKYCVIEDLSHYFNERIQSPSFMSQTSGNQAFERYNVLARDVMHTLFYKAQQMRPDLKVVIIHHVDKDTDGRQQFRVFGKLLGDKLDPVSYVRIVLHSRVLMDQKDLDKRYVFQTNDDGMHQAKSPNGMFDNMFIPNKLYAALQAVEQYDVPQAEEELTNKPQ
jgi:hypothetical protein